MGLLRLGFDCGQNFVGVALWSDLIPNLADLSVGTDPECHPHDPKKRFSKERLHSASAISLDDMEFGIGEQWKVQVVFGFELRLRLDGIGAAAGNGGVQYDELLDGVAELGRFIGSTRRVGLRKEI